MLISSREVVALDGGREIVDLMPLHILSADLNRI
jgi:hypothetical protein